MSFPVRCFTCNKVIGCLEQRYNSMIDEGVSREDTLNNLKISRYCCRRMFLSHVDVISQLLKYSDRTNVSSKKDSKKY